VEKGKRVKEFDTKIELEPKDCQQFLGPRDQPFSLLTMRKKVLTKPHKNPKTLKLG
jgi:hypothetical protein